MSDKRGKVVRQSERVKNKSRPAATLAQATIVQRSTRYHRPRDEAAGRDADAASMTHSSPSESSTPNSVGPPKQNNKTSGRKLVFEPFRSMFAPPRRSTKACAGVEDRRASLAPGNDSACVRGMRAAMSSTALDGGSSRRSRQSTSPAPNRRSFIDRVLNNPPDTQILSASRHDEMQTIMGEMAAIRKTQQQETARQRAMMSTVAQPMPTNKDTSNQPPNLSHASTDTSLSSSFSNVVFVSHAAATVPNVQPVASATGAVRRTVGFPTESDPLRAKAAPVAPPTPTSAEVMEPLMMFMQQQQQQMAKFMADMMVDRERDRAAARVEREEERADRTADRANALRMREEVAALERELQQMRLDQVAGQSAASPQGAASTDRGRMPAQVTQSNIGCGAFDDPPNAACNVNANRPQSTPHTFGSGRERASGSASNIPQYQGHQPYQMGVNAPEIGAAQRVFQYEPHRRVVDLPKFSGGADQWPFFIGRFRDTTAAYGYSDLENQGRLDLSLSGEAREAVLFMMIRPENVEACLTVLERKFGRPDILARSQLQSVRNLPALDEKKLEQLEPFATKVENLVRFLDHATTRPYLNDPSILEELVAKLPPNRRMEWGSNVVQLGRMPNLTDFSRWLVETAHKAHWGTVPTVQSATAAQRTRGKHVLLNSVTPRAHHTSRPCTFCSQAHRLAECDHFKALTVRERWEETNHRHLCTHCLTAGHGPETCRYKRTCETDGCGKLHHPLLHADDVDESARRPKAAVEQSSSTPAPSQTPKRAPRSAKTHSEICTHPPTAGQAVLVDSTTTATPVVASNSAVDQRPAETASTRTHRNPFTPFVQIVREEPDDLVLYRIIPVKLFGPNRVIETYAMMDDGAAVTVIDSELATELELDGPVRDLTFRWWGNHSSNESVREVSLGISGVGHYNRRHELHKVRAVNKFELPVQSVNLKELHSRYHHLRNLPVAGYKNAVPKILLGDDYHHLCVPLKLRMRPDLHGLAAVKTKLGWVVYGRDDQQRTATVARVMHCRTETMKEQRIDELERTVKEYYSTENFGVMQPANDLESDEDLHARQTLESTTVRIGDRYQTGLLWRANAKPFPSSYQMALQRLRSVEAKMQRDSAYAMQYDEQISNYVTKGYARKLTSAEADLHDARTWYLPHFGVKNPNKPGKFRLVFDAAASVNGVSLNSALLSGPDLNQPLTLILMKFRMGTVGICADIREMFHQVLIRPEDQNSQRFLWRHGDRDATPDVYVMQAMTFGATCSPTSAQFVKNVNASEHTGICAAAADAIKSLHYVDDYVASFGSASEAAEVTANVVRIHRLGGFELRGFVSNCPSTLAALGEIPRPGQSVALQLETAVTNKILGMCWRTEEDMFSFEVGFVRVPPSVMSGARSPTKREILSAAMSVFDPFGLVADFVLPAKLLVQDLWRVGIEWDETVPADIDRRWRAWRAEVERLGTLRIPRCYSAHIRTADGIQLHVFADASEAAFAAVAYWRITVGGLNEVAFIVGKTKCAPLKLLSIPRLELQAAVLATRLMLTVKRSHDIAIERTVMWTDSRTVEQWVKSDQRRFKPFVAHRVAEVLDGIGASCWRWLPTADNVADDGTRVKTPLRFNPESRWLRGPAFLQQSEDKWPQKTEPAEGDIGDTEEIRARFLGVTRVDRPFDFTPYSSLNRVCRTVAILVRFVYNARARKLGKEKVEGELGVHEVEDAFLRLIRASQADIFSADISDMLAGDQVSDSSPIFNLMPYLDPDQKIIRLAGRADAADAEYLPLDAKRPILLPRHHRLTKLVARHHHELMGHQLEDATIASIRQRFWVPQLRSLVRSTKKDCQTCRVRTAKPSSTILGQLPTDRLTPYVRPFTFTGLDYFGPVMVTVGRKHEKRWVGLFTCLTTRAVHMELAADLSADACLLAVRNFANTRGIPQRIRSDNGTNFVGAWGEIKREPAFFADDAMKRGMTKMGIEWLFNCPGNPEAGGAWERLVQSTKRILAVTLKEVFPRVETLRGLLIEAANIINSRPLTHVPVEPTDLEPLTPNHFLIGGPNSTTTPGPIEDRLPCARKQWRICQQLVNRFWARWVRDYMPELTRRSKHYPEVAPLKVGDLVLICDANASRNQWRRGRVMTTAAGPDGRVRTAEVRTADGTIRRPITRLAVLDVSSMSPAV